MAYISRLTGRKLIVKTWRSEVPIDPPVPPPEPPPEPSDADTRVWWSDDEDDYTDIPITGVLEYNSLEVDGHSQMDAVKILVGTDVTEIGYQALSGCRLLKSISIPESVVEIEDRAFMDCTSLLGVSLPKSMYGVGVGAFKGCSSLRHVEFPVDIDLRTLESCLFQGCSSLESIEIPQAVVSIFAGAFSGCSSLANLTIPSGVTYIGQNAFSDCSSMESVMFLGKTMQQVKDIENAIGSTSWAGDSSLKYYPWGLDESVIHAELEDEEPDEPVVPPDQETVTISWDLNGGTDGNGNTSIPDSVVEVGSAIPIPTATRDDYLFDGWWNENEKLEPGAIASNNTMYVAMWKTDADDIETVFNSPEFIERINQIRTQYPTYQITPETEEATQQLIQGLSENPPFPNSYQETIDSVNDQVEIEPEIDFSHMGGVPTDEDRYCYSLRK